MVVTKNDSVVNIAFRGTEEYRARLQRVALDRGVKVQDLIEQAIDHYLSAEFSVESPNANSDADIELAQKLLAWLRNPKKPSVEHGVARVALIMCGVTDPDAILPPPPPVIPIQQPLSLKRRR